MKTEGLIKEFDDLYGPYFTYREFECRCEHCAEERRRDSDISYWFTNPEFNAFMQVLMALRSEAGFPFVITSGYRCPDYNNEISSTGLGGPHTKGAADIAVTFERAYRINQLASAKNLGLGVSQSGSLAKRFFHLDNLGPRLWSY